MLLGFILSQMAYFTLVNMASRVITNVKQLYMKFFFNFYSFQKRVQIDGPRIITTKITEL